MASLTAWSRPEPTSNPKIWEWLTPVQAVTATDVMGFADDPEQLAATRSAVSNTGVRNTDSEASPRKAFALALARAGCRARPERRYALSTSSAVPAAPK